MHHLFIRLFLIGFLFSSPLALGQIKELSLYEVGNFGGVRLKSPCKFGGADFECTIDTMGSASVVAEGPAFAAYPVIKERKITGIGFSITCQELSVGDFSLLGMVPEQGPLDMTAFVVLRCPMQNVDFPLIGLPFFEGKKFHFDFLNSGFGWTMLPGNSLPLRRFGGDARWIGYSTNLGGESVLVSFDTGNPVTMVKKAFVDAHPGLFRFSEKEMNPGLKAKGLVPYEMLAPFKIGGITLEAQYVYAIESLPFPGVEELQVILGMNHMRNARWSFDLEQNTFKIGL